MQNVEATDDKRNTIVRLLENVWDKFPWNTLSVLLPLISETFLQCFVLHICSLNQPVVDISSPKDPRSKEPSHGSPYPSSLQNSAFSEPTTGGEEREDSRNARRSYRGITGVPHVGIRPLSDQAMFGAGGVLEGV